MFTLIFVRFMTDYNVSMLRILQQDWDGEVFNFLYICMHIQIREWKLLSGRDSKATKLVLSASDLL